MTADDRPRYAHWFRCRSCAHRFSVKRLTSDPDKVKTPHCPRRACGGKVRQSHMEDIPMDVAAGRAPAHVGHVQVRAFDEALAITAQDHGMTDIKDTRRQGENSAPSLRPDLQRQADSFWSNQPKRKTGRGQVDMTPLFGERAQQGAAGAHRFTADQGSAIQPILQNPNKRQGDSPIPPHVVIAG